MRGVSVLAAVVGALVLATGASAGIVRSDVTAKPDAVHWSVTYCTANGSAPAALVTVAGPTGEYAHRFGFPRFHHLGCSVLTLSWADYRWAPGVWHTRVRVVVDGERDRTGWQTFTLARRFP